MRTKALQTIRGRLALPASVLFTLLLAALAPPACAAPVNDNFANAIQITGTNAVVTGSNAAATMQPGEPNDYDYDGNSVWWYWQAPGTGWVTISTDGSTSQNALLDGGESGYSLYDDLEIYTGDSIANLNWVASGQDDADNSVTASFKTQAGVTYRIAVLGVNYYGEAVEYPTYTDYGHIRLSLSFSYGLPVAPGWNLPDIQGGYLSSTNFAGDVVVLNFWATWCGPCCDELPSLIQLQQNYSADGLTVVGLSVDSAVNNQPPTSLVASTAANYGINYPVAMTAPYGYDVESAYGGIAYIPNAFIIDRQNHIEATFVGEQSYDTYEQAVLPLLYSNLKLNATVAPGGGLQLSWPITQAGFVVQQTSDLSSGHWTLNTDGVYSDGVNYYVQITPGPGNQFYRLQME